MTSIVIENALVRYIPESDSFELYLRFADDSDAALKELGYGRDMVVPSVHGRTYLRMRHDRINQETFEGYADILHTCYVSRGKVVLIEKIELTSEGSSIDVKSKGGVYFRIPSLDRGRAVIGVRVLDSIDEAFASFIEFSRVNALSRMQYISKLKTRKLQDRAERIIANSRYGILTSDLFPIDLDAERRILEMQINDRWPLQNPCLSAEARRDEKKTGGIKMKFVNNTGFKFAFTKDMVKKVIFNNPATIVFWADDTKTIVKVAEGEIYDPEKGFAMCCVKKIFDEDYKKVLKHKVYSQIKDKGLEGNLEGGTEDGEKK